MTFGIGLTRRCDWPGCGASFEADTGPSERGWVRPRPLGMDVLLCPGHAGAGHLPKTWILSGEGPSRVQVLCSCSWEAESADVTRGAARLRWQGHLT